MCEHNQRALILTPYHNQLQYYGIRHLIHPWYRSLHASITLPLHITQVATLVASILPLHILCSNSLIMANLYQRFHSIMVCMSLSFLTLLDKVCNRSLQNLLTQIIWSTYMWINIFILVRSSYIPAFQAAPAYSSTPFRVRFIAAKISHYFLQFQNSKLSPLLSNYLTRAGPNTPGYGSGVIVV